MGDQWILQENLAGGAAGRRMGFRADTLAFMATPFGIPACVITSRSSATQLPLSTREASPSSPTLSCGFPGYP